MDLFFLLAAGIQSRGDQTVVYGIQGGSMLMGSSCPSAKPSPSAACVKVLPREALQLAVALAQAPRSPGSSGMGLGSSHCRNQSKTPSKSS